MKRIVHLLILSLVLLAAIPVNSPALAQSYSFAVPELKMQVFVQPDASAKIIYDITFDNYGSTIDIVDIGMPHSGYDIRTMRASMNGVGLSRIYKSEYIDVGVEVHLQGQAIPSGQSGTLHFEFTMPDMVYQDTTNKQNASLQITPTWFDASSIRGTSTIQLAIHMLEGVEPESVVYQKTPFTDKVLYEGHVVALWQWENTPAIQSYLVGISFPQKGMERVVKMTLFDLMKKWLVDNPGTRIILGTAVVILFAFIFFRFTGGTGCTVFAILAAILVALFVMSPLSVLFTIPVFVALVIFNENSLKKRRKDYLPAVANVEGGGIKRGLTAPEAAVLLELPLNKVLALVIFGLLEKGLVKHVKDEPLEVEVSPEFLTFHDPENRKSIKARRNLRRKVAQKQGTVIRSYEHYFLDQLERKPGKALENINFSKPMERLITLTTQQMKGFDLSDTQDYYRRIIDKAMEQASSLGEIEQRQEYLDKYLPWVMMNEQYPTVLSHEDYHYWPVWARRSYASRAHQASSAGRPARTTSAGGRTSFGDVAASFSGWAESTMGGMAAAIMPGSMNLPTTKGGLVDLSGVDKVTGDVFEALSKASSSGGRSGGSSCACACAGCACACACAGGGR